jgi:hypothetical protein
MFPRYLVHIVFKIILFDDFIKFYDNGGFTTHTLNEVKAVIVCCNENLMKSSDKIILKTVCTKYRGNMTTQTSALKLRNDNYKSHSYKTVFHSQRRE